MHPAGNGRRADLLHLGELALGRAVEQPAQEALGALVEVGQEQVAVPQRRVEGQADGGVLDPPGAHDAPPAARRLLVPLRPGDRLPGLPPPGAVLDEAVVAERGDLAVAESVERMRGEWREVLDRLGSV